MALDRGPGPSGSGGFFSGQPPFKLLGAVAVVIAIGVLLAVIVFSSGGDEPPRTSVRPTQAPTSESGGLLSGTPLASPEATIALNQPTVVAPPSVLQTVATGDRLVLPKYGISGPLTIKKVGADGVMPDPSNPDEIAYYDFSAWAGLGGAPGKGPGNNAIFSGHVDSGFKPCKNGMVPPPCQAVLWELRNVKVGDEVEVYLGNQTLRYRVTASQNFLTNDAPWSDIVAATAQETVTLITCTGSFSSGEYNRRHVITAVRIL